MKLITCHECGGKVSIKAQQCENCGDSESIADYQDWRKEKIALRNEKLGRFLFISLSLPFLMFAIGFLLEGSFIFAGICLFLFFILIFFLV